MSTLAEIAAKCAVALLDLHAALRHGAGDGALRELLETALRVKPLEHQFRNHYQPCRPMTAIGG
jgi:hypothetical protein